MYFLEGTVSGKRYVGITNNLPRRLGEHRTSESTAGQILGQFQLIHSEQFPGYATARAREEFLKSGQGREWLNSLYPRSRPASGGQGCARA
ncbi:MAG TPA: GIY-YIG nuclease family protein [Verrucomicrobiae bacterium]|nr:GIY-YIG nuclease family protein [Verrucomicrobiae bacterium]